MIRYYDNYYVGNGFTNPQGLDNDCSSENSSQFLWLKLDILNNDPPQPLNNYDFAIRWTNLVQTYHLFNSEMIFSDYPGLDENARISDIRVLQQPDNTKIN